MPGQWQDSTRRATLPRDWHRRRQRILTRDDNRCTWTLDNGTRCNQQARHVDHITRGGGDQDTNLRALCAWHHGRKSSAEGNEARTRPTERRSPENHPGLM